MGNVMVVVLSMFLAVSAVAQVLDTNALIRLDPAVDAIVRADTKVEKLAGGFWRNEGPVWVRNGGYLVFSDIPPTTRSTSGIPRMARFPC